MTVTASSAIAANISALTTNAFTLTGVPAGATIVLGIQNRTDETTEIVSIADTVNGAWTPNYVNGPVDSTATTMRGWFAYFNNAAAGDPLITMTFGSAISSQVAPGYIVSDVGVLSLDAVATVYQSAGNETNVDSNTATATGAGAIVGFEVMQNSQADPEPTADGAGEARMTAGQGGARSFLFFETYSAAGSYGFETTTDSAAAMFMVGAFLEPGDATKIARGLGRQFFFRGVRP
jgi:hypothetical protein